MSQINLLGFLCEAFGQNKKIYKDIDLIYQKRKYEFYRLAKEHELYNHQLITEGSLLQEEYSKKILGILLYQYNEPDDEEIVYDIDRLVKKGWPYVYSFLSHSEVSLSEFMKRFAKKSGSIKNLTDDDINASLTILLVMSLSIGKTVVQDDFYNTVMQTYFDRLEHYKSDNRINIKHISTDDKKNIKRIKDIIFKKVGTIKDYMTLLECLAGTKLNESIELLFDYENLTSSIFNFVEFNDKDVDEIIFLYYIFNKDLDKIDSDDAVKFYLYSMYIKYLIKCYKQVKVHYFKNNKETQFAELEIKDKEITKLKAKLQQKEVSEIDLINKVDELTKKIDKLTVELETERLKNNELNSLREFMFCLDAEIEYKEIDIEYERLKGIKAAILGGHERWQAKMKQTLPECIFIHTDMLNFDLNILNNVNDIFIYVNYLNHAMYYKVMDYIKGKNKNIYYLNQQNEKFVLMEIQKRIIK